MNKELFWFKFKVKPNNVLRVSEVVPHHSMLFGFTFTSEPRFHQRGLHIKLFRQETNVWEKRQIKIRVNTSLKKPSIINNATKNDRNLENKLSDSWF